MDTTNNSEDFCRTSLQNAICLENATAVCCEHTAELIRNGKIRQRFGDISAAAKQNKQWLLKRFKETGVAAAPDTERHCSVCKLNPDNFSLDGAINLCLELTEGAISSYKKLSETTQNDGDREMFASFLEEKIQGRDFLKKEQQFSREVPEVNLIDSFCIPNVSKLVK